MIDTRKNIKYMRLSLEDDEVDGVLQDESNSITSQRHILNQYIAGHPELGTDFEEIIDDGFTGTTFQRPGMEKLIRLVEAGEVNMIIVKDLSRFGRNYLEAGYYIELVFPAYQVRLIAVTDFYDTAQQDCSGGDIGLALNNIKNELFSRDISAKVKSTLDIQRRNGQYAGRVPYGYLTGPTKHDIIVDPEAAAVVKRIFHMATEEHMKTSEIARKLNSEGVPSPSMYKAEKRNYKGKVQPFWTKDNVYRTLIRRIYTGSFEMYQQHLKGVGSKLSSGIPRDKRIVIPNTHEAIITESIYEAAQKIIRHQTPKRRRKAVPPPPEHVLARYLKCGCCGCKLFQTHSGEPNYECHNARWRTDGECWQVNCDAAALEPVVFHSIEKLVQLADQEAQENRTAAQDAEDRGAKLKNAIRSLKDKRKAINGHKVELYEQLKCGDLTLQDFKKSKQACNDEEAVLQSLLERNIEELASVRAEIEALSQAAKASVLPPVTEDHLTPELLKAFVQKVVIHPDGSPEIIYKVKNVFYP